MPLLGASPLGSNSVDLVARQRVVSALEWTLAREGGREGRETERAGEREGEREEGKREERGRERFCDDFLRLKKDNLILQIF